MELEGKVKIMGYNCISNAACKGHITLMKVRQV